MGKIHFFFFFLEDADHTFWNHYGPIEVGLRGQILHFSDFLSQIYGPSHIGSENLQF